MHFTTHGQMWHAERESSFDVNLPPVWSAIPLTCVLICFVLFPYFSFWIQTRGYREHLRRRFYVQMSRCTPVFGNNPPETNILSRKPIFSTTLSSKPLKNVSSTVTGQVCVYISPLEEIFFFSFFIVHLKIFQYETPRRWVNTLLFYHAHSPAHGMLQWNILTY